jgi:diphthine synthase
LFLRAAKLSIEVRVIHNASIISAVGCCGLQVYRFGEVVSVPLWTQKWRPDSWYPKILQNRKSGLHTLVLVDIKVKERTEENILKDRKIYEPPRFMTIR